MAAPVRLQVFLARVGLGSRRACEQLVLGGRVRVNGEVVRQLGTKIDPERDVVEVDGRRVSAVTGFRYYLVYKPVGYVTTVRDPQGRPTVMDLIPRDVRVYPVGRLDIDSEGLVLLTNDGQLAYRLMHPRYGVEKEYRVLVEGRLSDQALDRLRRGVVLDDGVTSPARVDVLGRESDRTWLRVVLHEGRKRQVRRMIAAVGGRVERLVRVRLGPLRIGKLRPGQHRPLTPVEVQTLWQGWRHGSTDGGSD